jgi:hypothetical protein
MGEPNCLLLYCQVVVIYGVEGVQEVTAAIMAGVSFVATGNLAAPLAWSFAAQVSA